MGYAVNRKVVYAETFGGPISVRIVSYHTETLSSAISRRWVEVQVTKSVVNPYVEGYRFICSWDNIWLKHRYTQGGLHSFYEGKPQWDPEKTCTERCRGLSIRSAT